MNVTFTEMENSVIITLTGESDPAGIKRFSEIVENINQNIKKDVEIDLSEAVYLDSSSIGVLIKLHKSQKQRELGFAITKASDRVLSLLKLCSLSEALQ
ncbi:MAG TPA: STAS domain-containing protein [Spirochaetota bacterium]|nr:STAS domain-containing protein [Spirochaetota bacterium]HPJ36533.1 STAS domain-containing protein [Spirochaetota bacterium]